MIRTNKTLFVPALNTVLLMGLTAGLTCWPLNVSWAQTATAPNADKLTPSELEELLGPIALYPDPLLANVLAASVYPDEVAEAVKFMATKPTKEALKAKPWEDPVKAVAEFPEVMKMMGDYPDWTVAVGQAYLAQAKDVMDVVQALRKKAWDNGALKSSPEMTVQQEKEVIYIEPADPEIIYVPSYSPQVVYVDHHDDDDWVAGALGFGLGITAGLIIGNNMDCHWHGGCVGWGGGWGDVDIDRDVNIEGDVNIGNRGDTTVNRGDRSNTINGGDRTNVQGGDRNASRNRVGNEGNAWAPNKNKNLASNKPSQAGNMRSGASNRMSTPDSGRGGARPGQQPAGGANRGGGARAGQQPAGGSSRAGGGAARPSQQPAGGANRAGGASGARPSQPSSGSRVPQNRPPSGFSGGSSTRQDSARGSSSRNSASRSSGSRSSGASRSSGGSRSGGASRGGGSRGGGGRGGGGGGRR